MSISRSILRESFAKIEESVGTGHPINELANHCNVESNYCLAGRSPSPKALSAKVRNENVPRDFGI